MSKVRAARVEQSNNLTMREPSLARYFDVPEGFEALSPCVAIWALVWGHTCRVVEHGFECGRNPVDRTATPALDVRIAKIDIGELWPIRES